MGQFSLAEPIVKQIRSLEKSRDSLTLPPECYEVGFKKISGKTELIAGKRDISAKGMQLMIDTFRNVCDSEIERLTKRLEEI